jgi:hypothetical protein
VTRLTMFGEVFHGGVGRRECFENMVQDFVGRRVGFRSEVALRDLARSIFWKNKGLGVVNIVARQTQCLGVVLLPAAGGVARGVTDASLTAMAARCLAGCLYSHHIFRHVVMPLEQIK